MATITTADLITRVKRRMSQHMLAEIEGVSGEELFEVFSAMLARAGLHRAEKMKARLLRDATAAARGTGTVTVTFAEPTGADGYSVSADQVLFKTPWGVRFKLTGAITRSALEAAGNEVVAIEAEWSGFEGNVDAGEINEWAIADQNNIDSLTFGIGSSEGAREEFLTGVRDGTITFSASATTGGRPGTLDLRARGRGTSRAASETDSNLRTRLRTAPDAITPNGILRAVDKALGTDGAAELREYWEYGFAFGLSGFGYHAFSQVRTALVIVPSGSDTEAIQLLVNKIKAAGYNIKVVEAA